MSYQVIEPCTDPVYQDFMQHKIKGNAYTLAHSGKYENFYKCSGLWNRGCRKCSLNELDRLIEWMCSGDCYESSDKKSLFVHGYSVNDMM